MDPENVPAKFEVCSFTHSWDNSDLSFGWGLQTPNLGEEEAVGSGMVVFERALVSSYRPSIVTFPLIFMRFRDIAAFVLQHATFAHPTSGLP